MSFERLSGEAPPRSGFSRRGGVWGGAFARSVCALILAGLAASASAQSMGAPDSPTSEAAAPAPPSPVQADATAQPSEAEAKFLLDSLGPPAGVALTGDALERRTHEISSLVRCPVCQGAAVADSPSTMAQNMKGEVRNLLARGYDQEQIIRYFELSYGEFVRLQPKADGFNVLLWAMPLLVLLGGLGAAMVALRKLRQEKGAPALRVVEDPLPEDPELARHVLRVRERAYGWPGGVRPRGEGGNDG